MTTVTVGEAPKPYHHGDLGRALVEAAMAIIERGEAGSLSLRAVAREAGVSAAAPYHHFKDKDELLFAVAREGFRRLRRAMNAIEGKASPQSIGVAYVEFAHANPALYRVMYDSARRIDRLPESTNPKESWLVFLREVLIEANGGEISETDLELSVMAIWCAAHGLAELSTFRQFAPLQAAVGAERTFLRAVFDHMGYGAPPVTAKP